MIKCDGSSNFVVRHVSIWCYRGVITNAKSDITRDSKMAKSDIVDDGIRKKSGKKRYPGACKMAKSDITGACKMAKSAIPNDSAILKYPILSGF